MLEFLKRPEEDVRIELPTVHIIYHHRTKTVFLYDFDPATPDNAFEAFEKHLKKRGYFLQIMRAGASVPLPPQIEAARRLESVTQ